MDTLQIKQIKDENERLKQKYSELEKRLQLYESRNSELEQLEWMLKSKNIGSENIIPDYGDLSELNKNGLILSSVGKEQLKNISSEFLDLLETSAAIYELNGDYALGLFSSGWCRLMDEASRKLCNTKDNKEALDSGKWLCHESCWKEASLECIKKNKPLDIKCNGGINLYAVPIKANDKVVGAINFGYGDPPTEEKKLKKLSEKYKIPIKKLKEAANAYQKRPPFIIELAKQRIKISASRIGHIIEIKQAQKDLQERVKELNCLYQIANLSIDPKISTDHYLQKIVEIIPQSWQYPEITCARILFNGKNYQTAIFSETKWKQSTDIYLHKKKMGAVEVYYLQQKQELDEGPFLNEERSLINAIAKNITQFIKRKEAENAQQQSEENLRITLNSIGDAVIATDIQGRITQINPVAEKLTGWNIQKALNQNISNVFRIFNAQTGQKVDNPVKKVLETGNTVGLANHTKLISKNGNEYQIADSGSPIKNSKGETVGVVLVFRDVMDEYKLLEDLKESETKHKSLFNSIRDAILVTDTNRRIIQCNPAFFELFGYSKETIIGKETSYLYKNLDEFKLMGQKIKKNMDNPNFLLPVSYKKKNGTVFIGETNVFYLKNSKSEIEGFIGMIRDITEKIKTEKALQQNEERFRKIVEGAPDPIFIQTEMKFSYLNPVACKLFGIKSQDELLGTPVLERFHPDFHDKIYDRIHRLNVDRESVSKLFEQKFIRVDGTEVWVETVGEPIHYDGKNGALVFVRDISERKEAEQILKESEQKYRTIFENTGTATTILEKDGMISLANSKFVELSGYSAEEIENKKNWMEFVAPEDLKWMYQQHELRRKNKKEALTEYEFRFINRNKKVKNIFLTIDVIPGTQQSVASLLDITEKVNAEKALQQSEERFRNLFENMSSCVAVYQAVDNGNNFIIVDFNAAAQKAEKISEEEVLGRLVTEVFPGITEFGLLDTFKRVWATGKPENHPVTEYKDNRITGWRKNYIYKLPSGEIISLYDDVTEQRKAQLDLIESEARFRNLFETMAQGVVYQNDKGEIIMANKAAEKILGLSFKQMIGKKSADPNWRAVDKNKKELPGEKHPAMIALNTGKEVKDFIQGIYNPKKNDYVWIIVNSKPQFKKDSQKPYQVFSTFLDFTERKKTVDELHELKNNLEKEIQTKTKELTERVAELERFQEATIEREFRIKELRDEIEKLKANNK
ncbi:MAG: PAS domain S-box protein [Thiohalospira sp.]